MKKAEFQRRLKYSKYPVIVDLWAPWCAPCRAMQPAFKQISQEFDGKVEVLKLNADESQEVLRELHVMSIPTVIGFSGEKEIIRRTGMQSADALRIMFESTLNGRKPVVMPPTPLGRIIRTVAGIGVIVAGWFLDRSILLFVLGGILVFSAFYDRCPIIKALTPRIKALFHRQGKETSVS